MVLHWGRSGWIRSTGLIPVNLKRFTSHLKGSSVVGEIATFKASNYLLKLFFFLKFRLILTTDIKWTLSFWKNGFGELTTTAHTVSLQGKPVCTKAKRLTANSLLDTHWWSGSGSQCPRFYRETSSLPPDRRNVPPQSVAPNLTQTGGTFLVWSDRILDPIENAGKRHIGSYPPSVLPLLDNLEMITREREKSRDMYMTHLW